MTQYDPTLRLRKPERRQAEMAVLAVDDCVAADAPVRAIWDAICQLDLATFYEQLKARGVSPGRAAIDPQVQLALWVFATSEGVGSARKLEQLCERDVMYRWICGGVSVNHHTLSDFRTGNQKAIDGLLSQVIGRLTAAGIITLRGVAQDGMRVRAHAGAASFRKEETLRECLEQAEKEVSRLREQLQDDTTASTRQQRASREHAAQARLDAVKAALEEMPNLLEQRATQRKRDKKRADKRKAPRISTTDPEARVTKMADGGFRPAYNVQFATDVDSGCITGVKVTNEGVDSHQLKPMLEQIRERIGRLPIEYLVDGGYSTAENIEELVRQGSTGFMPVRKSKDPTVDPYSPRKSDSEEVAAWRERMSTTDAKETYKQRAATAERVNAEMRSKQGMTQFKVKGLTKVTSVVLLAALTFNLLRHLSLMA